jgi:hypothetical protein
MRRLGLANDVERIRRLRDGAIVRVNQQRL